MMRKLPTALAVAASSVLALGSTPAMAWNSWCDTDPPLTVVTPSGQHVTINNWISVPAEDRAMLRDMVVTGDTEPGDEAGTTIVHIHVSTPDGGARFVHVTSSAGRYQETTEAAGDWGSDIELDLTVPVG